MSDYLGTETAAAFSDPGQEYVELRSGCALYDLGWRAKIAATGGDRVRWLNGMLTNNVRDLARGHGNYNFLLNAQGRVLADLYVYNRGEYLLLDTPRWQAPKLIEVLDKFIIMDDVEITDITDKLTGVAVQGPRARDVLRAAGFGFADVEPLQMQDITWSEIGLSITRMASDLSQTYELWMAPANAAPMWDQIVAHGARPVGTDALETFRLAAGIPRYSADISERYLPQETDQAQALNFQKGCYIGQEIVERIHARGMVHRKLTGFVIEGAPPAPGAKIEAAGKEAGEITSAVAAPGKGDRAWALGYLRVEARAAGAQVQVAGTRARVIPLPYRELVD
jgi:folate-binding protein YgfZ